ncbi:MAG TPA: hypothetical protein VKD26_08220 [Streptosporangiaceae bacterium]|nr:hypothetical protein [Streptosporangiaceae bacterium]
MRPAIPGMLRMLRMVGMLAGRSPFLWRACLAGVTFAAPVPAAAARVVRARVVRPGSLRMEPRLGKEARP